MGFIFEKLDVYQRALAFADKVDSAIAAFLRGHMVLGDQLKRAAISISLNIAEGCGRWHKADKKQFYLVSRGSAYECVAAIELCQRRSLLDADAYSGLRLDLEALSQMLTKLIQSVS